MARKRAFFQEIGYEPHGPEQMAYHESTARFKVPICGRRFGKSTGAVKDKEAEFLGPDRRYWIIGPTYNLAEKEFRVLWDDFMIKLNLISDKRVKRAYNVRAGEMFIELPWKTRIECRSADHPEGLVGEALDGAIMSEAAKHNIETWDRFIRPALADKRGWADFPSTPEGMNWLYQLWQFGQNPEYGDYESWNFPSWMNKVIFPGGRDDPEIKLLEATMSPEAFMQEIGASFASFVGKIYAEFDENLHVRKVGFNENWPSYIAFDWGYANPMAAIEFQIDPQDNVYVWREHYKSHTSMAEHVRLMRDREQPTNWRLDLGFGDAADPEAAEWMSANFVPTVADPNSKINWLGGIELVKSFLREVPFGADDYDRPIMRPKLFIDHSCVNTIREFNTYRTAEGKAGRNASETDQKCDNHALDALRYGLVHIYKLGATSHLSDMGDLVSSAVVDGGSSGGIFNFGDRAKVW